MPEVLDAAQEKNKGFHWRTLDAILELCESTREDNWMMRHAARAY